MFESLINPRKAERKPWEMFFVGLFYASLSVLLADWVFMKDPVLSKYVSMFIVMFTTIFTLPFMYYMIKQEEKKDCNDTEDKGNHYRAIFSLLFLFLGFIIAFSILYAVLPQDISSKNFQAQIETYCSINQPSEFASCVEKEIKNAGINSVTSGAISPWDYVLKIVTNNIFVMVFIIVFSFAFGAGAIFVLSWNAAVIASAIGIFTHSSLDHIPTGLARYMIHGLPEIASYFMAALAGGILSVAFIRHNYKDDKFWRSVKSSLGLLVLAIIVLFLSALVEVFVTSQLF